MVVEALEASFRYPVDFSFHIQNFSQLLYSRTVKPTHQATLFYSFIPAETFAGRPFGLSVNLHYRDAVSEVLYSNFLVICLFFIAVLFLLGWHSLPWSCIQWNCQCCGDRGRIGWGNLFPVCVPCCLRCSPVGCWPAFPFICRPRSPGRTIVQESSSGWNWHQQRRRRWLRLGTSWNSKLQ